MWIESNLELCTSILRFVRDWIVWMRGARLRYAFVIITDHSLSGGNEDASEVSLERVPAKIFDKLAFCTRYNQVCFTMIASKSPVEKTLKLKCMVAQAYFDIGSDKT